MRKRHLIRPSLWPLSYTGTLLAHLLEAGFEPATKGLLRHDLFLVPQLRNLRIYFIQKKDLITHTQKMTRRQDLAENHETCFNDYIILKWGAATFDNFEWGCQTSIRKFTSGDWSRRQKVLSKEIDIVNLAIAREIEMKRKLCSRYSAVIQHRLV